MERRGTRPAVEQKQKAPQTHLNLTKTVKNRESKKGRKRLLEEC